MTATDIRILGPGDEAALEAFLLPRIETSMFLVGNMRDSGLTDNGQPYEGSYAAAFEGRRITGVVAHYWNRNLVFQAPVHLDALWRGAAEASRRPIGGLIGPSDQVAMACDQLGIENSRIQLDARENLYSLELRDLIVPDGLASSKFTGRRIEAVDLDLLTRWTVAYYTEAIGTKDSPQLWQATRSSVERSLKEGRTWVLERQGEPVACSSFNAAIEEAVQVGGVFTPPELRRRGYGRSVVAASLLDARSQGVEKAILFTGEDNTAAQKAYTALGFAHIGDYRIVLLHSPTEAV